MTSPLRPTWAEIDLGAITHNARWLREHVAPAQLCAVVKAWAYGHGPVQVAEAALHGGATWLAVALVEEGRVMRSAGITEPILLLSEPAPDAFGELVRLQLTPTLYTARGVAAAAGAARAAGRGPLAVHVKVDTGMHRVGAPMDDALQIVRAVAAEPALQLQGLYTHFAVADEPERDDFTAAQLARLTSVVNGARAEGIRPPLVHAANSAAAIRCAESRLDLVRCGIALYGQAPSRDLIEETKELRPALALKSRVLYVKVVEAGEGVSYGLRYTTPQRTVIATVPIGYADGVPRALARTGGEVLVNGQRRPIAGTVTMDQIMVDCGPNSSVSVGDEVVLIGEQAGDRITAWDWADRCDTIAYEILCGVSSRVPRTFVR